MNRFINLTLGLCLAAAFGYIASLGEGLAHQDPAQRPVLAMIAAFVIASVFYLIACWRWMFSAAARSSESSSELGSIVGFAILFRLILLFTDPILEVDLYRYIWDGEVAVATADPYQYAPVEFLQWRYPENYRIPFTRSMVDQQWIETFAAQQSPGMQQVLQRVHFGNFTSPYPPVSQVFFAASQWICPAESSMETRVVSMKSMLVLFDLAVGFVLLLILRRVQLSDNFCVAWFWCPLVMKEFANSGHLDSIAIFFCILAVLFMVRQLQAVRLGDALKLSFFVAMFLSLGIGAKVFPIVLVPLWAIATLRKLGLAAVLPGFALAITTLAINVPLLEKVQAYRNAAAETSGENLLPTPGIMAFAESWEINDMIFMVIVENLKPVDQQNAAWFSVVPESWRQQAEDSLTPFQLTRMITTAMFAAILIVLAVRWWRTDEDESVGEFLNCLFLSLAWFWFLSPTQNPWYWCWAIPLLPFTRRKTWFLVAALVLYYYSRFHFENHKLPMNDFHFFVPFYQFLPVLVLLAIESWRQKSQIGSQHRAVSKTEP